SCFSEFAFNIILIDKTISPISIDCHIGCFPACFTGNQLCSVCLFSAILACIKFLCCLISECICSHNRRICFRNRELDPLVLSYLSVEDFSFTCIFNRPVYEKVTIPDTFGGKKNPFCIHSVEYILKTAPFITDDTVKGYFHIFVPDFICCIVEHRPDRFNFKGIRLILSDFPQVNEE